MFSKKTSVIFILQLVCMSLVTSNLIQKKCLTNSECDVENECCYFPTEYFTISTQGYCQQYLKKGDNCKWKTDCGCKPGLKCTYNWYDISCQ